MSSGLTPILLPEAASVWRSALESMSAQSSPCRDLPQPKWAMIWENALAFCDQFGADAHRLGWTAPELFAVHREHGTIRLHACGVMIISGEPAQGIDATRVLFEQTSGYRNTPGQE